MGDLVSNLLKSESPIMDYYLDMNYIYMLLDVNERCGLGQDYGSITVTVVAYNEKLTGELDPDSVVTTWVRTYERFQLQSREEPDGMPPWNIRVSLDNYWYEVQLCFNYDYGIRNHESQMSTFQLDNRITTMTAPVNATGDVPFILSGTLKDNLERTNELNVWITPDLIPQSEYKENDIVSNPTGTILRQVKSGVLVFPEQNYMDLIIYIMNHKDLPTENTFILQSNHSRYTINFKGGLNAK